MSSQIDLIAIISPKQGKAERVVELLNEMANFVQKNEPGTLKYQVTLEKKKSGAQSIVMLETYKDKAAMGAHGSTKEFKAFQQKLVDEDLVGGPMQLKVIQDVGGFSSRL